MGVIARQSIKGAIANYIGVAIGFFTTFFVITRYLTPEEVGLTRVLVDAATLFSSIALLGSSSSVVRFFPYFKDGRGNHGIFGLSVLVPLVGFALLATAMLVFKDEITAVYSRQSPLLADYFYMLPMLTFCALYVTVFENNASVLMRITVPKAVREVGIRVFTLATYLLYGYRVIGLDMFVWLFCGCYAVAMLLNLGYLLRLGNISFRVDWRFIGRDRGKEMLRYTLFITVTVLATYIPFVNTLFLGAKTGLAAAGIYSIAANIANVVEVPFRSLGAISKPVIATAVKEDRWDEVNHLGRQVSLHQLLVSLLIFYIIWINLDALFAVIPNGSFYAAGSGVVLALGLAKVVNSSLSASTDVLNFSRHYSRGLLFTVTLTVATLVLNPLLIDLWGINGSACTSLIAYGIYYALLLTYLWVRLRVSLFSRAQLRLLAVMGAMFALDWCWGQWVAPHIGGLVAGAVVKTGVLTTVATVAIYRLHLSDSVNDIIDRYLLRKRKP